ncbi:MAG: GPR endopeptidase [Bacilli bacterium]|nr:GPR endopeptidase [Bacilli bacterium]
MSHDIDLDKYKIRTDLLIDTIEASKEKIDVLVDKRKDDDIAITVVDVDKKQEQSIGKKAGRYITIEFVDVTDHDNKEKLINVFKKELKELLNHLKINDDFTCLVIGLGNDSSTPDALGPTVVKDIIVTKHLFELNEVEDGFREVSALSPGVMGTTGIETGDIIEAVVKKIKPDFLLIIDALASQSIARVNKTIQMSDSGINPGSGVGNKRKEISKEKLGIPVIAIGVPTVVDAATIVSETINYLYKHVSYYKKNLNNPRNRLIKPGSINYMKDNNLNLLDDKEKITLLGLLGELTDEEMKRLIYEVLSPIGYNLMVTPKEIDFLIIKLSEVLAKGINGALHKKVT